MIQPIIREHQGRKMYDYDFNTPGHEYNLTLDDPLNPKWASYYIWKLDQDWVAAWKQDLETITGRKIRDLKTYNRGNGHGDFQIEFLD